MLWDIWESFSFATLAEWETPNSLAAACDEQDSFCFNLL